MHRSVGLPASPSPQNRLFSALLSLSLSTALVLIPVLPIRAADSRRAPSEERDAAPPVRAHAATAAPAALLAAPSLTATKTDAFADPDGDGKAEPGQTITYTVTITNSGPDDATGVVFNDTVDANTTLVPGSVKTQPVATGDSYSVLGNVRIQPNAAAGLLANDCDPDNGGPCSSAGLTASAPSATSAQGGNVSVNPDGSFSYNPPAGYEGADSFTYTVTDASGLSDTGVVSLTVSDVVWFVDNGAAAGGDGRLTSPYNSLSPLNGAGGAGDPDESFDVIFVHEGAGAYAGGIALEDNQRLVGQGTSLDTALSAFSIAVPPHSDARPAATGNPVIANAAGDAVALASNNAVLYVNASAGLASSYAISGNGIGGSTLISGTNAIATGAAGGVGLVNAAGPVAMTGGSVAGTSTGVAVVVNGGGAAVSFTNTSVSQSGGGRVVEIQNRAGGSTVHFAGTSTVTGTNGATDAVVLFNNAATSAITFSAPINLSTVSNGARGLFANGGFTVNIASGSTVSSTSGPAVDLDGISANINFSTTFSTNSSGSGVIVESVSGSASFGTTTVNGSDATGVVMADNSAAVTFSDLDIAPDAGQRALHATNNTGTITSSSGVITSSGEVAVEITGTSSANRTPLNIQLESLSADGTNTAASGLVLTNTSAAGSPGGFRVNGTGAVAPQGGTIQNTTTRGADIQNAASIVLKNMNFTSANSTVDAGNLLVCDDLNIAGCNSAIYLNDVAGATLDNVRLTGTMVENGITAVSVSDFHLDNSLLEGCGNQAFESCVEAQNLSGTATVSGTEIRFSATNSFDVVNTNSNLSLTISNSIFRDTQTTLAAVANPIGAGGLQFRSFDTAAGQATSTINIVNSQFLRIRTQAAQVIAEDDSVVNVDVFTSTIDSGAGNGAGLDLSANDAGRLNFNVLSNPSILTRQGAAVNVVTFSGGQAQGRINDNPNIRVRGTGAAGSGIRMIAQDASAIVAEARRNGVTLEATNNSNAIDAQARFLTARLDLTLDDNTTSVQSSALADINLTSGASTANEQSALCANLVSNNASGTGAARALRLRISDLDATSDPRLYLEGFVEAGTPNQDAEATWNAKGNTPVSVANSEVVTSLTAGATHPSAPPTVNCNIVTIPADLVALPAPASALQVAAAAEAAPARESAVAASDAGFSPARGFFGSNLWPRKTDGGFAYAGRALSAGTLAAVRPAAVTTAATLSGETISVPVGTLRAGDSVTITFQVTVANSVPSGTTQVSNQGTVTADGGISVLTDDPTVGGANDPTVTPLLLPPTIKVNDATVVEPATGSANMLFTVTLDHAYTQAVSVSYDTANTGSAAAGTDYTTTTGSVSFAAGETVKTVSVPVLADGEAGEGNETFNLDLSNAVNGTIGDGSATGTITDETVASAVIISELRTSGPGGAGDDFVELLNTTDADVTVPSGGWVLVASGSACADSPAVVATIPAGAVIPARGNYLLKGSAYSLAAYAAGDQTLTTDIADDSNVGLFAAADLASIGSANRLDAVGFGGKESDNCDLLREGTTLPNAAGSTSEYSFVRKVTKGQTQDTTDSAADFVLVSTTPATAVGAGTPTLGAPGPEGSGDERGPVPCSATAGAAKFGRDLIDPTASAAAAPNVVRDATAVTNGAFGTLDFRRTFTNNTGQPVTALRFRITNRTGAADLRALSSSVIVVSTAAGNKTVQGATVDTPPAQALGGGLNSSLAAGTVTLATQLAPGASVNLHFLFGVEQAGDYDLGFVIESSPVASGKDFWRLTGHTEDGGHTDAGCNRPPVANAGADITAECSAGEASVTLDGSASTDPDGDTPLTFEWKEGATSLGTGQTLGHTFALGSHTVTLIVTDPSGDSSQDTVIVNVVDTAAPQVTAPTDITVNTGPGATSCSVNVANVGTATAADSCQGSLTATGTRSDNLALTDPYPVGTTTITWTATDAAGNPGSDTQTVTVIDNTAPTATAPADITVPNDPGSCSANVNPGTATGSDNCGVQTIVGTRSDNQPLNAAYPVGTTTITWTVTDIHGNTATDTQTVTVQDTQAPSLLSSVVVALMGPPFNHALVNVGLSASATDNCPGLGAYQVSVYSDEDDGAAPHSPDATDIGVGSLKLRRERDGSGDGRVYLVVVRVTDAYGNTSASCSTVGVPLSNSSTNVASVNAQAASAASFCSANNGAAPAGYFVVGP